MKRRNAISVLSLNMSDRAPVRLTYLFNFYSVQHGCNFCQSSISEVKFLLFCPSCLEKTWDHEITRMGI